MMRRLVGGVVLVGVWVFLLLAPVWAAGPDAPSAVWPSLEAMGPKAALASPDGALIVSIEKYADPDMPPIEGARQSGRDWQRWFTQTRGIRADRVRWLEDKQGTRTAILRELGDLSKKVGKKGTVWVVFVGHGAPAKDGKEGILLGWYAQAGDEDEFYGQSVRHSELVQAAKSGRPGNVVMVLDACFSGRSSSGAPLVKGRQASLMIDVPKATSGVLMLTAAQKD